jgi:hypothetical protein
MRLGWGAGSLEQGLSLERAWTLGGDPDPERMLNLGVAQSGVRVETAETGQGRRDGEPEGLGDAESFQAVP